jgi:hypothetical protein
MSSTAQNQTTTTDAALSNPSDTRELSYEQMIFCSALIGIAGGLVATAYYYVLEACLHLVWHTLPEFLEPYFPASIPSWNYVWIATTIGGFLVGLTLYFMGLPGEVAFVVDKVHSPGRIS